MRFRNYFVITLFQVIHQPIIQNDDRANKLNEENE